MKTEMTEFTATENGELRATWYIKLTLTPEEEAAYWTKAIDHYFKQCKKNHEYLIKNRPFQKGKQNERIRFNNQHKKPSLYF